MRPHEMKNILKVGVFLTFLLAITMIFIVFIGKENAVFSTKVNIRGRSDSAQNLKEGAFVQLKGIKVGQVSNVDIISQQQVEIVASIDEKYNKWIKNDSVMEINNAGLVGDKFLAIKGGSEDAPMASSETVLKVAPPLAVDQFVGQGEDLVKKAIELLGRLNRLTGELEQDNRFAKMVKNFENSSEKLALITKQMSNAKLKQTLSQFSDIMNRVENGPGTAHSFLYNDMLHEKLINLLGGAERNQVLKYFIRKSIEDAEEKTQIQ